MILGVAADDCEFVGDDAGLDIRLWGFVELPSGSPPFETLVGVGLVTNPDGINIEDAPP